MVKYFNNFYFVILFLNMFVFKFKVYVYLNLLCSFGFVIFIKGIVRFVVMGICYFLLVI